MRYPREYDSYAGAEREADQSAGDTGEPYAVVEDFGRPGVFLVMRLANAEAYVSAGDAEIQYAAILTCQVCGDPQNAGPHTH